MTIARRLAALVLILVLVGVGAAWWCMDADGIVVGEESRKTCKLDSSEDVPAIETRDGDHRSGLDASVTYDVAAPSAGTADSNAGERSIDSVSNLRSGGSAGSVSIREASSELQSHSGAVAEPGGLSKSILQVCWGDAPRGRYCEMVREEYEKFLGESREVVWATRTEDLLRNIAWSDSRVMDVRFVECRASICLIEVASKDQGYVGLGADNLGSLGLIPGVIRRDPYWVLPSTLVGIEELPDGSLVKVVLSILSKRP